MASMEDWLAVKKTRSARGTKEYRREQARKAEILEDLLKYRGYTLDDLGIKNEEGANRPIYRTIGPGGRYSDTGSWGNTNFIYDWASGKKLNIATNAQAFPDEAVMNSNGQMVFDPAKAKPERWEAISPQEYASQADQQNWNANNPGLSYADRLAQTGMKEMVGQGHFTKDAASGLYWNKRPDGSMEWKDQFGRLTSGPEGFTVPSIPGGPPSLPPGNPPPSSIPKPPPTGLPGFSPNGPMTKSLGGLPSIRGKQMGPSQLPGGTSEMWEGEPGGDPGYPDPPPLPPGLPPIPPPPPINEIPPPPQQSEPHTYGYEGGYGSGSAPITPPIYGNYLYNSIFGIKPNANTMYPKSRLKGTAPTKPGMPTPTTFNPTVTNRYY